MPDYSQMASDPYYEFVYRKVARMRPDQQAIMSDLVAGSSWLSKGLGENLASMQARMLEEQRANKLASQGRAQNLAETSFQQNLDLANRKVKFGEEQNRIGTGLGIANVLAQTWAGSREAQERRKQIAANRELMERWRLPDNWYASPGPRP